MASRLRRTLFAAVSCLLFTTVVGAQQLRIAGTVDDGTGVLPGVMVSLRDSTGRSRQVTTSGAGEYQFDALSGGAYQLTVSRDGYAIATRVVTLTSDSQTVNVTLRPAVVASVDVVGEVSPGLSVTAPTTAGSRLNLPAIDTPAAVTTLSGTDIRLRGDASVNAAVTLATGITSTTDVDSGGNTVAVRGFEGGSVALLYDGIRNAAALGNIAWPYDPWTVERIEILNGPASVLYGVGGIGGSINVIPRRPSRTPEHAARLSAGSFNTYNAAFGTTGPVSDRISYRFDISRQTSKNHIDRGDSESTALAGSLAFTISDNLRATLLNEFGYIQPMTYNGLPMVNGVAQESLREENYATSDSRTYHKENSTRIDIDWTTNPTFSIRNVTSFLWGIRQWKMGPTELNYQPETNDILRSGYVIFDHDQFQWSNQFVATSRRALGNRDNALSVGGEIEHIDLIHLVDAWPDVTSVVSLVDPEPGLYPTTPFTRVSGQNNLVYEYAGFVDDRLAVTPKLSVVGGVRYDVHQHDRTDLVTANHTVVSRTIHSLNGRVGLVYALRPNLNLYGQYSKASDVGAGLVGISAENLLRLDPTRGHQVEVGLKQSALAGRLEWTLAGYRILKKDLLIPDPERFNTFVQIGSQSSQGIEASATVNVGSSLRIAANGTVLNPQFEDFFELVDGVRTSRRGNRPSRIPVESANVMVTWTVPKWLAQGTLRHVGDRYINRANTLKLPAYTVVDASLRRTLTNQIAVDAKVSNVFDAFYPYNFVDNGRGGGSWMVGAQRAFSVVLTATF